MPNFVVIKEDQPPRELTVSGALIGIGRDARNEVCLTDPDHYVSRFHAVLVRIGNEPERYFIRDLSSISGIRVNGSSAYQRLLADGDSIQIAGYELIYGSGMTSGPRPSRLRVVSHKSASDPGAATALMPAVNSRRLFAKDSDRDEIIREFLLRTAHIRDMRSLLDRLMPGLVRVMNADRGFAGVFIGRTPAYEEIGATGMQTDDQIEIEDPNAIDAVLAGSVVHEGTTLLAPIQRGSRTAGFFCLDRFRPAPPFNDDDTEFLAGLSRLVAADSGAAQGAAGSEEPLAWPAIFVGKSKAVAPLLDAAKEAAGASGNILILGENGSGKELVARMIHAHSRNSAGPFVGRNCAALPDTLAESELFGYAPRSGIANADVQGAPGWFELANRGTLFLDEVHSLTAAMQDKLLRVLEDREVWRLGARTAVKVDAMVIAATDKDLTDAVESDVFRRALYHRFARKLRVPSLRERKEDVRLLAHCFIDRFASERGGQTRVISQRALDELMNYDWPGNVRELQNVIGSCLSRAGEILFSWDLPPEIRATPIPASESGPATPDRQGEALPIVTMEEVEREKIAEALRSTRGNITRASQLLGYKSRQTMLNKMDHYGIPRDYGDSSGGRFGSL